MVLGDEEEDVGAVAGMIVDGFDKNMGNVAKRVVIMVLLLNRIAVEIVVVVGAAVVTVAMAIIGVEDELGHGVCEVDTILDDAVDSVAVDSLRNDADIPGVNVVVVDDANDDEGDGNGDVEVVELAVDDAMGEVSVDCDVNSDNSEADDVVGIEDKINDSDAVDILDDDIVGDVIGKEELAEDEVGKDLEARDEKKAYEGINVVDAVEIAMVVGLPSEAVDGGLGERNLVEDSIGIAIGLLAEDDTIDDLVEVGGDDLVPKN